MAPAAEAPRASQGRILLLTGPPGVGKTTLVRRVAAALPELRLGGFTTEEIRPAERRLGFRLVPFVGEPRVLAHVELRGHARVGRYGVDLAAIEAVAALTLRSLPAELYLVDEIGRMECLSPGFLAAVRHLLARRAPLVATVALRGAGLIREVKRRPDAEMWAVTTANRDELVSAVCGWIRSQRPNAGG